MTERKTLRNSTELPISVAIAKLRDIATERQTELDDAIEAVTKKVYDRFEERAKRITLRVPEELRQHVIDKAGLGGEVEPAASSKEAGDAADTSWLNEEPKQTTKPIVIDRSERRGR